MINPNEERTLSIVDGALDFYPCDFKQLIELLICKLREVGKRRSSPESTGVLELISIFQSYERINVFVHSESALNGRIFLFGWNSSSQDGVAPELMLKRSAVVCVSD